MKSGIRDTVESQLSSLMTGICYPDNKKSQIIENNSESLQKLKCTVRV